MTHPPRSLARAQSLLERQRRALLAGDLEALTGMPDQLDRALRMLMRDPPPAGDLARLKGYATRNADLIRAARKGVALTRDRRSGDAATPLATYDVAGRSAPVAATGRILSRG